MGKHTCVCVHQCVCVGVHVWLGVCVHTGAYTCMHVGLCVCACASACVHTCVHTYLCMCKCVCACMTTHMHTLSLQKLAVGTANTGDCCVSGLATLGITGHPCAVHWGVLSSECVAPRASAWLSPLATPVQEQPQEHTCIQPY